MSSHNLTKIRPYFSLMPVISVSMFSLVPQRSTWVHDTAAFAAKRRAAAHLLLSAPAARGAGTSRSISSARGALSSKPAGHQWDRQTDVRPFHRSCSACYAGSINKQIDRLTRWKHYSVKLWRRYASWMGALTAGYLLLCRVGGLLYQCCQQCFDGVLARYMLFRPVARG